MIHLFFLAVTLASIAGSLVGLFVDGGDDPRFADGRLEYRS